MKAEVITIGDEILSGNIVDTNFAWLGEQLWTRGFELNRHTSVPDESIDIQQALRSATEMKSIVIVTGGLGPTIDDITLESAAEAFSVPLVLNEEGLAMIQKRFVDMKREMAPNNAKQALLPKGSWLIPNANGTAPGCHWKIKDTHLFFLPGVPGEMKGMCERYVFPQLQSLHQPPLYFSQKILRCFGMPESTIDNQLKDLTLEGADLAFRVFFPEILLKVSDRGTDQDVVREKVDRLSRDIRHILGDTIYSEGDRDLPQIIGDLLKKRGETLSTAESCTGGRLANLITDCSGSSAYFDRGVITYSNQSKMDLLGVPENIIKEHGAVSSETAEAMAKGLLQRSKSTYALSLTGIAGPDGGTDAKPAGTVFIGFASSKKVTHRKLYFPTTRDWFKRMASFAALNLLRKALNDSTP